MEGKQSRGGSGTNMNGYKVFKIQMNGDLTSVYMSQVYMKGVVNKREEGCGPMAYFKKLERAKNFCEPRCGTKELFVIYKVKGRKSQQTSYWTKEVPAPFEGISDSLFLDTVELIEEVIRYNFTSGFFEPPQ